MLVTNNINGKICIDQPLDGKIIFGMLLILRVRPLALEGTVENVP
jgi:hypothetical protein